MEILRRLHKSGSEELGPSFSPKVCPDSSGFQTQARAIKSDKNLSRKHERGIALLMVLLMISLIGLAIFDFQYNSFVDLQLAVNARDELQAEYNAMTALKMRALLLKHSGRLQQSLGQLGSSLGQDMSGMMPIAKILEMVPVECGLLSALVRKADDDLAPFADEDAEAPAFFQGECIATSTSEHSKVALNMLRNNVNQRSEKVVQLLVRMLSDIKLERHFQEDDRNGVHAETPQELVEALVDWIDDDENQAFNNIGDEERHYDYLRDTYRVKNAPFDSIAEVQLVHGVDDEMFQLLRDNISIYTDATQIELQTTSPDRIILWGIPATLREGASVDQIPVEALAILYNSLIEVMGLGLLNVQGLKGLIQQAGLDAYVDLSLVGEVFTDKAQTTWFTIEAQGRSGNASRRVRAVFQAKEGQFYYVRME